MARRVFVTICTVTIISCRCFAHHKTHQKSMHL
nr:MAG TPA: hypothetical protein [Caudoviricetes sp.]